MVRSWSPHQLLADDAWRYALVVGFASVPVTVALYWLSMPDFSHSFAPVFVAGVVGGYLASIKGFSARRTGVRIGLVGALPVLWPFVDLVTSIIGWGYPHWIIGAGTVALVTFAIALVGVSAVIGTIGSMLSAWLLEQIGTSRSTTNPSPR